MSDVAKSNADHAIMTQKHVDWVAVVGRGWQTAAFDRNAKTVPNALGAELGPVTSWWVMIGFELPR